MAVHEQITPEEAATVRQIARDSWDVARADGDLMVPDHEPIQQCDGGYWVPALLFVSDDQVARRKRCGECPPQGCEDAQPCEGL